MKEAEVGEQAQSRWNGARQRIATQLEHTAATNNTGPWRGGYGSPTFQGNANCLKFTTYVNPVKFPNAVGIVPPSRLPLTAKLLEDQAYSDLRA